MKDGIAIKTAYFSYLNDTTPENKVISPNADKKEENKEQNEENQEKKEVVDKEEENKDKNEVAKKEDKITTKKELPFGVMPLLACTSKFLFKIRLI